jgi:hypothetical protein
VEYPLYVGKIQGDTEYSGADDRSDGCGPQQVEDDFYLLPGHGTMAEGDGKPFGGAFGIRLGPTVDECLRVLRLADGLPVHGIKSVVWVGAGDDSVGNIGTVGFLSADDIVRDAKAGEQVFDEVRADGGREKNELDADGT